MANPPIVGGSGNDILVGVDGTDNLIYGDTDVTLSGTTGGNDTITGGANGTNTIYGDADTLMGEAAKGGDDTLIGGANSINMLVGDANHFTVATGGDDTLIGGVGGSNTLIGDGIDTTGPANGGNDRLVSADNTTDDMWGDFKSGVGSNPPVTAGHDTFVFSQHNGNDIINDFQKGLDTIELDGFFKNPRIPTQAADHIPPQAGGHVLETFADLTIDEVNGNSVIHFDANNSVTAGGRHGADGARFQFRSLSLTGLGPLLSGLSPLLLEIGAALMPERAKGRAPRP